MRDSFANRVSLILFTLFVLPFKYSSKPSSKARTSTNPETIRSQALPSILCRPKASPCETISKEYDLEYGSAVIEMHRDSIQPGQKVVLVQHRSHIPKNNPFLRKIRNTPNIFFHFFHPFMLLSLICTSFPCIKVYP